MTTPSDDAHETNPSTTRSTPVSPGENPDTVGAGGAAVPGEELPRRHKQTQPLAPDGTPVPVDDESHLTADTEGEEVDAQHGAYPSDAKAQSPRRGPGPRR